MIFNLMKPVPTTESATMYSYNGVELPKLPNEVKEYPFAVMFKDTHGNYYVSLSNGVPTLIGNTLKLNGGGSLHTPWFSRNKWLFIESYANENNNFTESWFSQMTIFWANVDIVNEEGIVVQSGTDSVPPQIFGYSYNGTVLPALPEWDKETYPYAVITGSYVNYFGEILYSLDLTRTPLIYDEKTGDITVEEKGYSIYATFRESKGGWGDFEQVKMASDWAKSDDFVWTNNDIVRADDSVHYLASDPVPVYE